MIFVTVGTMFPFDRLIKALDELIESKAITEPVFAQIGKGTYLPKYFEYVDFLSRKEFKTKVNSASAIICHAGTGSITEANRSLKPLIVMPRQRKFGEHVDDHQIATANFYVALGCALMAITKNDLLKQIEKLSSFKPKLRIPNSMPLVLDIKKFLEENI